jgi:hypothetical protein
MVPSSLKALQNLEFSVNVLDELSRALTSFPRTLKYEGRGLRLTSAEPYEKLLNRLLRSVTKRGFKYLRPFIVEGIRSHVAASGWPFAYAIVEVSGYWKIIRFADLQRG